jgi:hypothetical protein
METTNAHLARPALANLRQVLAVVQGVLDLATTRARGFFEDREVDVDTFLFPDLVRYEAKCLFQQERCREAGYRFTALSSNGLFLTYQHNGYLYEIRVRKADEDGDLPSDNLSQTLKDFYNQPQPYLTGLSPVDVAALVPPHTLRLVVVWDVDQFYVLGELFLACPRTELGDVHFAVQIEHAATAISVDGDFDDEPDELDGYEIEPLERTGTEDEAGEDGDTE